MSIKHTYIVDLPQLKVEALESDTGVVLRRTYYGPEQVQVGWIEFDLSDEARLFELLAERSSKRSAGGKNVTIH